MPSTTQDLLTRMRAHKGNLPTLPKTKYCTLCPATFTRTMHLNRHLRSHTNDRMYRCNLCQTSEFTRSDLLIRHKRTCGQCLNRFRKRSCESCAESKVKCNLEAPCARCTSRGRECVFKNHPKQLIDQVSKPAREYTGSICSTRGSPPPTSSRYPFPSPDEHSQATSRSSLSPNPSPTLSESGVSSTDHSSTCSQDLPTFDEPADFSIEIAAYGDVIDSAAFECLGPALQADFDAVLNWSGFSTVAMNQEMDLFACSIRAPPSPPPPDPPGESTLSTLTSSTFTLQYVNAVDLQLLFGTSSSTFDIYLHLFFTRFLEQVPLIHVPTWKMADTSPILTRIFCACGALFINTPEAVAFVETTLLSVTAEIIQEVNALSTVYVKATPEDGAFNDTDGPAADVPHFHDHLIIGLVLLQTIDLIRRGTDGLVPPNSQHHRLLVTMIQQTRLIERVASWKPPDHAGTIALQLLWTKWAEFETLKRRGIISLNNFVS
ncbi:hypothetical protein B0H14DRAFT_3635157 [Mycena olivaceomarginata]|nr:hypothetical protein B0H14DRAFT_3635157 [Mycena olivaceomarginata]